MIILFAAPAFAQTAGTAGPLNGKFSTEFWSHLSEPTEGTKGFRLESRGIRESKAGQYELWIKILPTNISVFNKHYNLPVSSAYALQFATVDCTNKLLKLEKTMLYNSADKIIEGQTSRLTPSTKRDTVKPGSIGATVFENVCIKP